MEESFFDIAVSRALTAEQFAAVVTGLVRAGIRVDVRSTYPSETGADIWATVESTDDPSWPCMFTCWWHPVGVDGLGPFPDLRIASGLCKCYGVDCFCKVYPFAGDFDPHDPYWWLACVNGQWYVADASGVPLVTGEESGSGIKLVRPISIPDDPAAS